MTVRDSGSAHGPWETMKAAVDTETGGDILPGRRWALRARNHRLNCFSRVFVKAQGTAGFLVNGCVCCPVAAAVEHSAFSWQENIWTNHHDLF